MSRKRPRITYPPLNSADEVVNWFVEHRGKPDDVIWSHEKFVFVKATSMYTGNMFQLGYMAQQIFIPLVEIMFVGNPVTRFIIDDFYYDNI